MGIDRWKWEGIEMLIVFPHTSTMQQSFQRHKCFSDVKRSHILVLYSVQLCYFHRYVRSTRCRTSYSRCIISCSHG